MTRNDQTIKVCCGVTMTAHVVNDDRSDFGKVTYSVKSPAMLEPLTFSTLAEAETCFEAEVLGELNLAVA